MRVLTAFDVLPSPARVHAPTRAPVRVGLVQLAWDPDPGRHDDAICTGVAAAAAAGARLVCLPELTRSRYFAVEARAANAPAVLPEALPGGPTYELVAECARSSGVHVHASCYEAASDGGLGYNTAFVVAPDGALVARTRKTHLPVTAGYYEDTWFRPGDSGWPVHDIAGAHLGFPTCWDQWFPETSRAYALGGAEVIVYPTAIGSEPDHPGFDTEPLWEQVIRAQGIMNGTFMIVVNRAGSELHGSLASPSLAPLRPHGLTFYGSSFVSDPYGRVLVQAPRDEPAVLVADLDLDQCRDWLDLFPLISTRRPGTYGPLLDER